MQTIGTLTVAVGIALAATSHVIGIKALAAASVVVVLLGLVLSIAGRKPGEPV